MSPFDCVNEATGFYAGKGAGRAMGEKHGSNSFRASNGVSKYDRPDGRNKLGSHTEKMVRDMIFSGRLDAREMPHISEKHPNVAGKREIRRGKGVRMKLEDYYYFQHKGRKNRKGKVQGKYKSRPIIVWER